MPVQRYKRTKIASHIFRVCSKIPGSPGINGAASAKLVDPITHFPFNIELQAEVPYPEAVVRS